MHNVEVNFANALLKLTQMQEGISQNQEQESVKKEIFTKKMIEYQRQKTMIGKRINLIDPSISEFAAPLPRKLSCLKEPSHDNSKLFLETMGSATINGSQL